VERRAGIAAAAVAQRNDRRADAAACARYRGHRLRLPLSPAASFPLPSFPHATNLTPAATDACCLLLVSSNLFCSLLLLDAVAVRALARFSLASWLAAACRACGYESRTLT